MTPDVRLMRAGGAVILLGGLLLAAGSMASGDSSGATSTTSPLAAASTTTDPADVTTTETTGLFWLTTTTRPSTSATVTSTTSPVDTGSTTSTTTPSPSNPPTTLTSVPATTVPGTPTTIDLSAETYRRLREAADAARFAVVAPSDGAWVLVSLDTARTDRAVYVATSYRRGSDFATIYQEQAASYPEVPDSTPITIRGAEGRLLDMGGIVLVRWVEADTAVTLSTDLSKDLALALIEAMRPIS
jgi:hypothetical protein